jgi:hypothetical protein
VNKFIKSARSATQIHRKYTREKYPTKQEREKRVQKSTKLEIERRLAEIHSKMDLR